jgi:hypothetical protein
MMLFHFKDKSITIKHLSNILEVKKINSQTLKIRETLGNSLFEDLLYYEEEKIMDKDVKSLFHKLNEFVKTMHKLNLEKQIAGFAIGNDDGTDPESEC